MTIYYVYNIDWDTDGEDVDLPTSLAIDSEALGVVDDEAGTREIVSAISEYLSDEYEFCHNGFNWGYA